MKAQDCIRILSSDPDAEVRDVGGGDFDLRMVTRCGRWPSRCFEVDTGGRSVGQVEQELDEFRVEHREYVNQTREIVAGIREMIEDVKMSEEQREDIENKLDELESL